MDFYLFACIAVIAASFFLIVKGGDMFVDSAVWMAEITRMSQILIGATVVSIGTTLPEVTVSIISAAKGDHGLAVTNAVGSMLCNICLILGISLTLLVSRIERKKFMEKIVMVLLSAYLIFYFTFDGSLQMPESILMLLLFVIYMALNFMEASRENKKNKLAPLNANKNYFEAKGKNPVVMLLNFLFGAVFIGLGAYFLVENVSVLATQYLNISTTIVGITIVALGTALPELVTAVSALKKKAAGISIGNVIGANILNSTFLIGVIGLISQGGSAVYSDTLYIVSHGNLSTVRLGSIMCVISLLVLLIPIMLKGRTYVWQGITLLLFYVFYIVFLVLAVTGGIILY